MKGTKEQNTTESERTISATMAGLACPPDNVFVLRRIVNLLVGEDDEWLTRFADHLEARLHETTCPHCNGGGHGKRGA